MSNGIRNSKVRAKEIVKTADNYYMLLSANQDGNVFKDARIDLPKWFVEANVKEFEQYEHKGKAFRVLCEICYRGLKVFLRQLVDAKDTSEIMTEYFEGKRVISNRVSALAIAKATVLNLLAKNYEKINASGRYFELLNAATSAEKTAEYVKVYDLIKEILSQ